MNVTGQLTSRLGRSPPTRRFVFALLALLILLGLVVGTVTWQRFGTEIVMFLKQEYVPTTEGILNSSAATFVVEPLSIEGYYGYVDIPSMIFKYTVRDGRFDSKGALLSTIEERATRAGWELISHNADEMRFRRCYREAGLWCVQDVRLRLAFEEGTVFVCWTNADASNPISSIEDSREGTWVSSELWPRFRKWTTTRNPSNNGGS